VASEISRSPIFFRLSVFYFSDQIKSRLMAQTDKGAKTLDRFLGRAEPAARQTPEKKKSAVALAVAASPAPLMPDSKTPKKRQAKRPRKSTSEEHQSKAKSVSASPSPPRFDGETGNGSVKKPFVLPLREHYNSDGCMFCPTDHCCCEWIGDLMRRTFEKIKVKRTNGSTRHMCAKSLLPPFVTRLAKIASISASDTFVDLGCGNGSILFQIAFMTGARCIGVELQPQNADLARQAWDHIRPTLEKKAGKRMPDVTIVTGDLCEFIAGPEFGQSPSTVVWTANLLMPKPVTHFMSERFRSLPAGVRIACFDDLYPHSRSVARLRDPEAFDLFNMMDYMWQPMTVEWCADVGQFFLYTKKK
jgi:hypothetical protein